MALVDLRLDQKWKAIPREHAHRHCFDREMERYAAWTATPHHVRRLRITRNICIKTSVLPPLRSARPIGE